MPGKQGGGEGEHYMQLTITISIFFLKTLIPWVKAATTGYHSFPQPTGEQTDWRKRPGRKPSRVNSNSTPQRQQWLLQPNHQRSDTEAKTPGKKMSSIHWLPQGHPAPLPPLPGAPFLQPHCARELTGCPSTANAGNRKAEQASLTPGCPAGGIPPDPLHKDPWTWKFTPFSQELLSLGILKFQMKQAFYKYFWSFSECFIKWFGKQISFSVFATDLLILKGKLQKLWWMGQAGYLITLYSER